MREVNIGGKDYRVVASPITLFFYKKEFKRDLLGDLVAMEELEFDRTQFDGLAILQMAWAMIKTAKSGNLETFEQWLANLEYVDFESTSMTMNIVEEVRKGFFRGGEQTQQ